MIISPLPIPGLQVGAGGHPNISKFMDTFGSFWIVLHINPFHAER